MDVVFSPSTIALVFLVISVAGFVTGVTGFGFAVVGTGLLASILPSQTAILLMLFPMLAATLSLVNELESQHFSECVNRFGMFFVTILTGTVIGMLVLDSIPTQPLNLALGTFVLVYVAFIQSVLPVPGRAMLTSAVASPGRVEEGIIGFVSGLIFGATNIGVQVVTYVKTLNLDHSTFVGVLAMIFAGLTAIRIGLAAWLGLYVDIPLIMVSLGAVLPSLLSVRLGKIVRPQISEQQTNLGIVVLLTIIGIRLVTESLGLL